MINQFDLSSSQASAIAPELAQHALTTTLNLLGASRGYYGLVGGPTELSNDESNFWGGKNNLAKYFWKKILHSSIKNFQPQVQQLCLEQPCVFWTLDKLPKTQQIIN
jgi:hypothetical protein